MSQTTRTTASSVQPRDRRPTRTGWIVAGSVAAGLLMALLWSFELVDSVIGANVADTVLGHDAKQDPIAGTVAALAFAFVSGFAGTFTACNIAMVAAVGPMSRLELPDGPRAGAGWRVLLRPLGLLAAGMVAVSACYGFAGVLLGERLPQLSTDRVGDFPVRLIQSSVVFGVIGLALIYLGLAALGVLPDVFRRRPAARVVTLGALIGGFLIGRPYPLFNKLFHWAVDEGNPFYGALAFVLQSLGNILVVSVAFALLLLVTRGRFVSWLARSPRATAIVTGGLLLALGVFTVVYWDLRVPSNFGGGWFPVMPYNR
ncbi:hypothetical protein [Winogradskya humida]|uniref:Cytochrome C biogenesis protein transmembrane region n=1 Tax=Winogradskya humida TaxID=113566 RepID=A0ABQ4A1S6_9ACTN|nr:hypothetical protein [Actinoplanes humidus]GIE24563.1 hypothetical protein Ahu01nite_076650 [Actinoplanes humidus]